MYHHKSGNWLRKIEQEDLADLKALKNESWWGVHSTLIVNDLDQQRWFERLTDRDLFMMVMREDKKLGVTSFTNINHINRCCHASGSAFRTTSRANLAKEAWHCCIDFAFEMLNMNRCEAEVLAYNTPAQKRNIETIGMRVEGVRRQSVYKAGQYYDSILLGLLRSEWEADERVKGYGGSCNTDFDHEKARKLIERSKYV